MIITLIIVIIFSRKATRRFIRNKYPSLYLFLERRFVKILRRPVITIS